MFRFLGVSDAAAADCVARTSFDALSGGDTRPDGFFRQGLVGAWRTTLNQDANATVLRELGWSFPEFGWTA